MFLGLTDYILGIRYPISFRLPGFVHGADSDSRKWNFLQWSSRCRYGHNYWSLIPLAVNFADEITCSNRGKNKGHGPEQPADKKDVHGSRSGSGRQLL